MGDIKKLKKKFERPQKPWEKNRIIVERELINKYGYKNKKEVWRFKALLRGFRKQARQIVASPTVQAKKEGENLLNKLVSIGLLEKGKGFDNVLELNIDDISKRRLISMVVSKGLARSPKQARQFVTHRHIIVGGKKVSSPNYIVLKSEENMIQFADNSEFAKPGHPLIESMKNVNKEENPLKEKKENIEKKPKFDKNKKEAAKKPAENKNKKEADKKV